MLRPALVIFALFCAAMPAGAMAADVRCGCVVTSGTLPPAGPLKPFQVYDIRFERAYVTEPFVTSAASCHANGAGDAFYQQLRADGIRPKEPTVSCEARNASYAIDAWFDSTVDRLKGLGTRVSIVRFGGQ